MTRIQRAQVVLKKLKSYYPKPPVPLNHTDPYSLLIAVLLSARCTDERVNKVTPHLFEKAKCPEEMVGISVEEIRQIIRPCGLSPQKARAIHRLSEILIENHGGRVPDTFSDLECLPGVGHKTASVVMSQAFGHAAFPVDTHIHRLAQRWKLTQGPSVVQTERDLKKLFPPKSWNSLHLQFIYYGRQHCSAWTCFGLECDICRTLFPKRKKPVETHKS